MSLLTPSSSAEIVAFPTTQQWTTGEFERYREGWLRGVLADPELGNRGKTVNSVLFLYINRETGAAFPSYEAIARGAAISRRDARRELKATVDRGHLVRQPRERQRGGHDQFDKTGEFFYFPAVNGKPMVALRPHRGGSMGKSMGAQMGVDGGTANGVPLHAQGVIGGLPEDSLKDIDRSSLPRGPSGREGSKRRPGIFISSDDPRWASLVRPYARLVIGRTPPRGVRGWDFTPDEWHLIEAAAAAANGGGR